MNQININPFTENLSVNIGFQKDHNKTELIFDGLNTEDDKLFYLDLGLSDNEYQPIPLVNNKWVVTSTYTDKARVFKAQIVEKIDDKMVGHSPIFQLRIRPSVGGVETVKETVPPAFKGAYDKMVQVMEQIKTAFENGEFDGEDGKSAYDLAVEEGFIGTLEEWLDSLRYDHSEEFERLANQVRQDAQAASEAANDADTSAQAALQSEQNIKKVVGDFQNQYDTAVSGFNENAATKLNEFNQNAKTKTQEFNTLVEQANTTINGKISEATKQAEKATEEANRATQATDGKLDKNLGAESVNKLLGTDEAGNIVVKEEIEQTAENVKYGEDSNVDVALDDIYAKLGDLMYTPISITSFTNNKNTVEMGSTVTDVVLNWNYNKTPKTLSLDGSTLDVSLKTKTLTGQSIKANKTFTLKATDEREAVATKTTAIIFLNGVYYGIGDDLQISGITNQFILGLTKTLQSSKAKTFTVNAGVGKHIYYIIPTRYGTPVFKVGGFEGGFEKLGTVNFTNSSSYAENYDVYKSSNAGLGNTTVVVS